jgi:UDP-N-acetylmuramoylalanine--D-glutamate ligase
MIKKKRIVVLGAAESGLGAAILAQKKGFDVFISDFGIIKPKYKETIDRYNLHFEEGQHTDEIILSADEVIKSPGIAEKTPIIKKIREMGIPVISEIEFAGRYTDAKKICITGSNGKTTTTTLLYHMLKKAGLNVGLAGNVGKSFAWSVAEDNFDYYVIELSSFQLDGMFNFRADIAILLNITPDHLDRYDYNLQNYINSKFRITQNLTKDQFFIFCSDDDVTIRELEKIVLTSQKLPFSVKHIHRPGAFVDNSNMIINYQEDDFTMSLEDLALKGKHNTYNSMAAGIAAKVLEIRKEIIRESMTDFQGVEHRLESVLKIHGVDYINDSKATNVNSTWYALECQTSKVVWIAGGTDKGNDYAELNALVKEKVKALICLGKDNSKLIKAFDGIAPVIIDTHSITEAVKAAYKQAKNGDVVLLSPACASFDLFENYEDRGRQFKEVVREL